MPDTNCEAKRGDFQTSSNVWSFGSHVKFLLQQKKKKKKKNCEFNGEYSKIRVNFWSLGVTLNFFLPKKKKKKKKKLLAKHFLNKICLLTLVICSNHFIHYCSAGLLEIFHTLRSQSGVLPLFPRRPHWFTKCKRGTTNSNQIEHIMLNYVTLIICSERNTE